VKLPTFDGKEDVEGFMTRFEMACRALEATDPELKKVWLVGRMTGGALAWVQSLGKGLEGMGYQEVVHQLKEHFVGEEFSKLRKLQTCKQGSRSVAAYNEEYQVLAAASGNVAHPL
jgi:hypothetical protein